MNQSLEVRPLCALREGDFLLVLLICHIVYRPKLKEYDLSDTFRCLAWWHKSLIPSIREAEAGGSQ